jgi:hypothetical protein
LTSVTPVGMGLMSDADAAFRAMLWTSTVFAVTVAIDAMGNDSETVWFAPTGVTSSGVVLSTPDQRSMMPEMRPEVPPPVKVTDPVSVPSATL